MKNKASVKIKWLVAIIFIVFLTFTGMDFSRGIRMGIRAVRSQLVSGQIEEKSHSFLVVLQPEDRNLTWNQLDRHTKSLSLYEYAYVTTDTGVSFPRWLKIVKLFLTFITVVGTVWSLVNLIRLAVSIFKTEIIAFDNIRRLRNLAYLLGGFSLSIYIYQLIDYFFLKANLPIEGYAITLEQPSGTLLLALLMFLMTEILKIGYSLKEEQALTI